MTPPNIYYSALLMASGVSCLVVATLIWYMRRTATGAHSLAVFLLALSWWDITYAIFWIDFPGPTPYFWLDITLLGAFTVPTSFLIFSLQYAHLQKWLKRPMILALLIEPLATLVLLLTDSWHNLYFGGNRTLNTTRILDAGPVSWANIYYSYILIFIGIVILSLTLYRSVGIYRKQTTVILAATIIPWVVHISYISSGGLLPDADVTPFIFSITALAIAFALARYRLLDIVSIARSVLIENMSEGVIVLDTQNRVVDINPAAQSELHLSAKTSIGKPVEEVLSTWSDIVTKFQNVDRARVEIPLGNSYFDLRISPLLDHRGQFVGRLIVWRDITDLKHTQLKLEKLATMDVLTQVFNRRYFLEAAETNIKRAARLKQPLALALMDIDHFKNINDTFGHPAGDQALIAFAKICQENIREFDVFARFGGEEFALLMPGIGSKQASQVVERLRLIVSESTLDLDLHSVSITVSLGIADLAGEHDTLDLILHRADQALYAAKQSGRNRVVVWQESLET
jgi:diguanylate cyclase (GGDEF)-like protein